MAGWRCTVQWMVHWHTWGLSGPEEDESESNEGYLFAWLSEMQSDQWILRAPNFAAFKAAVEAGKLKGKITGSNLVEIEQEGLEEFIATTPNLWQNNELLIIRKFAPVTQQPDKHTQ